METAAAPVADATGGVTETGVTEPTSESPTQETHTETVSKSENRYQKLANENRTLREKAAKIAEYEKQIESLKDAKNLDAWLRADPKHAKAFLQMMGELDKPQVQEADPDEQYLNELAKVDPKAAALLREARQTRKELLEWKQAQERSQQEQQKSSSVEIQQTRDKEFDDYLETNGYTKEGKAVDSVVNDGFSKITLAYLAQNAKNWQRPTTEELKSACGYAHSVFNAGKKLGVRSITKNPAVPPTGTRNGGVPLTKGKDTDASRKARILAAMQ
jgi:hypothetical protein